MDTQPQVRWYRFLKSKEGRRDYALLEHHPLSTLHRHLVICSTESGFRNFAYFDSYLEFSRYQRPIPEERRHFYEIAFGSLPQKPHFDLDLTRDVLVHYPQAQGDLDLLLSWVVEALLNSIVATLAAKGVTLQPERDLLLYRSHGPDKRSVHVVVDHWSHSSNLEAKAFYEAVMLCLYPYRLIVDHSVYSQVQQFRLLGSRKNDTARPKVAWSPFPYRGEEVEHISSHGYEAGPLAEQGNLAESLLSFCSDCQPLPSYMVAGVGRTPSGQLDDLPDLDSSIQREAMLMLRHHPAHAKGRFSLQEVKGHIILLKRHQASLCPVCNRSHAHENPFLLIKGDQVRWYCRRSPNGTYHELGRLSSPVPEPEQQVNGRDEGPQLFFGVYSVPTEAPLTMPTLPASHTPPPLERIPLTTHSEIISKLDSLSYVPPTPERTQPDFSPVWDDVGW